MAATVAPRLLDVMETDILPMTERGVAAGNKVFGAALLRKSDMSLVLAGTNSETDNPLLHGEISTLNQFYEMPEDSRDAFGIPQDLKILKEVFGVEDGGYRRSNEFWTCYSVRDLIEFRARAAAHPVARAGPADPRRLRAAQYQDSKGNNDIPFN